MKVLIFGGTGLIGKALAAQLVSSGHEVKIASRSAAPAGLPEGVGAVQWDGKTAAGWEEAAQWAEAMINLAGENIGAKRWSTERKEAILESRLMAGQAICAAVRQGARPQVLVQASAVGYYGTSFTENFYERSKAGRDFLAKVCVDWEKSTAEVEAAGIRRVIVRTGVVLDPKEGALARMMMPFKLYVGGKLGSGRQWISWIHLQDEVNAIQFLLENSNARGAYNLAAPKPVTNAYFARVLGTVMKKPCWLPVPAWALQKLLGEMSTIVLDGQRVVCERLPAAGFSFKYTEIEPALSAILSHPD